MKLLSKDLLDGFKRECRNELFSREELNSFEPEDLLTLCYAYYHYFNGNPDKKDALREGGCFYHEYRGRAPHQIAGIFLASEEDTEIPAGTIDILVPIFCQGEKADTPAVLGKKIAELERCVYEALDGLRGTLDGNTTRSSIEKRLRNLGFKGLGNTQSPIRVLILTNIIATEKDSAKVDKKHLEERKVAADMLTSETVYGDAVEYEVYNTACAYPYVTYGELLLDRSTNSCGYENSCVVNVKASSLRTLYASSIHRGLLAQNLRFYVANKEVDEAIKETIAKTPDLFWYMNNGITIACESFIIDGRSLKLTNFSIVNGGQTTHNIGVIPDDQFVYDFSICCKIICGRSGISKEEQEDLLANVAISSNSQKPIKKQDLIANREEQRMMKRSLAECVPDAIFYATKRGEKFNKKAFPAPWQATSPAEVLQMVLSSRLQMPGSARNQKGASIAYYHDRVFCENGKLSPLFVRDHLIIKRLLESMKNAETKREGMTPEEAIRSGLIKNGIFCLQAILSAIYTAYLYPKKLETYANHYGDEDVQNLFCNLNVNFPFLRTPKEAEGALKKLVNYCIDNYLVPAYKAWGVTVGSPSYSNFTKTNSAYTKYILREIANKHKDVFPEEETTLVTAAFCFPSRSDAEEIFALESEFINTDDTIQLFLKLNQVIHTLPCSATDYPPTNGNLSKMAYRLPTSPNDLLGFYGLNPQQVERFGEELLKVIRNH